MCKIPECLKILGAHYYPNGYFQESMYTCEDETVLLECLVKRKAARATARASAQNYNLHLARQRARCA